MILNKLTMLVLFLTLQAFSFSSFANEFSVLKGKIATFHEKIFTSEIRSDANHTYSLIMDAKLSEKQKIELELMLYEILLKAPLSTPASYTLRYKTEIASKVGGNLSSLKRLGKPALIELRLRHMQALIEYVAYLKSLSIPNYKPQKVYGSDSGISGVRITIEEKKAARKAMIENIKRDKQVREANAMQRAVKKALKQFSPDSRRGKQMIKRLSVAFNKTPKEQEMLKIFLGKVVQPSKAEIKENKRQPSTQLVENAKRNRHELVENQINTAVHESNNNEATPEIDDIKQEQLITERQIWLLLLTIFFALIFSGALVLKSSKTS